MTAPLAPNAFRVNLGDGSDRFMGQAAAERVDGGAGNDKLDGGDGSRQT